MDIIRNVLTVVVVVSQMLVWYWWKIYNYSGITSLWYILCYLNIFLNLNKWSCSAINYITCRSTHIYGAYVVVLQRFHVKFSSCNIPTNIYVCILLSIWWNMINPLTAELFNLNFHPLEVVSRWRDPQLQVSENYSHLTNWRSTLFKSCWLMSHFIFNIFKMWYLMC